MLAEKFSQRFCWRFRSSGIWQCVGGWVVPIVLKDHDAFILKCPAVILGLLTSFKTSGTTHPPSQYQIPEDLNC